jgi:hypothetical protein
MNRYNFTEADLTAKRIEITYTDCGLFYSAYLYSTPKEFYEIHNSWFNKLRSKDEVNAWLNKMGIANQLLSSHLDLDTLNEICEELVEIGVNADYDNCFDPS